MLPFTGTEFLESLRDGRENWIYGQRVKDVTEHPAFRNPARMEHRKLKGRYQIGPGPLAARLGEESSGWCVGLMSPRLSSTPRDRAQLAATCCYGTGSLERG